MLLRKKKMLGWKRDDSQEKKNLPYDSKYGKGPFKPNLK
jgi:hypothetical protein